jgi:hypothetical protein
MAKNKVGEVFFDLLLRSTGFKQGLDEAEQQARQSSQQIDREIKKAGDGFDETTKKVGRLTEVLSKVLMPVAFTTAIIGAATQMEKLFNSSKRFREELEKIAASSSERLAGVAAEERASDIQRERLAILKEEQQLREQIRQKFENTDWWDSISVGFRDIVTSIDNAIQGADHLTESEKRRAEAAKQYDAIAKQTQERLALIEKRRLQEEREARERADAEERKRVQDRADEIIRKTRDLEDSQLEGIAKINAERARAVARLQQEIQQAETESIAVLLEQQLEALEKYYDARARKEQEHRIKEREEDAKREKERADTMARAMTGAINRIEAAQNAAFDRAMGRVAVSVQKIEEAVRLIGANSYRR